MRAAILYEYDTTRQKDGVCPTIEVGPVLFHEWGTDFEEFEMGAASYSVAIVELPDGTVKCVAPSLIRFTQPGG